MAWHDDPKHPFAGIAEKLKRADQNINNLNSEIESFIQGGLYPVLPHPNSEAWNKALSYHRDKPIPLTFSVLAGEVVHHLRSCLDHIAWHFSDETKRSISKIQNAIEFPIFADEPVKANDVERYERKVQAIDNADVLSLIKEMQPYKVGADSSDHALLIIHNMDRFDKHRELVIINSSIVVTFPPGRDDLRLKADLFSQNKLPQSEVLALSHALHDYGQSAPSVAFRNFGKRTPYPVIKGLVALWIAVNNAVGEFATLV